MTPRFKARNLVDELDFDPKMVDDFAQPRAVLIQPRGGGHPSNEMVGIIYDANEPQATKYVDELQEKGGKIGDDYVSGCGVETRLNPFGLGYLFKENFGLGGSPSGLTVRDRPLIRYVGGTREQMGALREDVVNNPEHYTIPASKSFS